MSCAQTSLHQNVLALKCRRPHVSRPNVEFRLELDQLQSFLNAVNHIFLSTRVIVIKKLAGQSTITLSSLPKVTFSRF